MNLNGFTGRTVLQVEREDTTLKIVFEDGTHLYVRAKGPDGTWLKITCSGTSCEPADCTGCHGIEQAASE